MKKIFTNICLGIMLICSGACNEKEFLAEVPLDFLSPENAYNNYSGFQSALAGIYSQVRDWETRTGGLHLRARAWI